MKKNIATIFIGLIVLGTSCKRELLDPAPETSVSDATAFDNPTRISSQVLSLYATLKSGNFYGGRYLIYGSVRGNEFLSEDPNLVTARDVWELNITNSSSSLKNFWAQAYFVINNCNVFIDGMNAKGAGVVGTTLANNYLAEARLIRAISYYSLLHSELRQTHSNCDACNRHTAAPALPRAASRANSP